MPCHSFLPNGRDSSVTIFATEVLPLEKWKPYSNIQWTFVKSKQWNHQGNNLRLAKLSLQKETNISNPARQLIKDTPLENKGQTTNTFGSDMVLGLQIPKTKTNNTYLNYPKLPFQKVVGTIRVVTLLHREVQTNVLSWKSNDLPSRVLSLEPASQIKVFEFPFCFIPRFSKKSKNPLSHN